MISRRALLFAAPALLCAPAIGARENPYLPPEYAAKIEPLWGGVQYQSWPFGTDRPFWYTAGSISNTKGKFFSEAHWFDKIKKYENGQEQFYWRTIRPCPPNPKSF